MTITRTKASKPLACSKTKELRSVTTHFKKVTTTYVDTTSHEPSTRSSRQHHPLSPKSIQPNFNMTTNELTEPKYQTKNNTINSNVRLKQRNQLLCRSTQNQKGIEQQTYSKPYTRIHDYKDDVEPPVRGIDSFGINHHHIKQHKAFLQGYSEKQNKIIDTPATLENLNHIPMLSQQTDTKSNPTRRTRDNRNLLQQLTINNLYPEKLETDITLFRNERRETKKVKNTVSTPTSLQLSFFEGNHMQMSTRSNNIIPQKIETTTSNRRQESQEDMKHDQVTENHLTRSAPHSSLLTPVQHKPIKIIKYTKTRNCAFQNLIKEPLRQNILRSTKKTNASPNQNPRNDLKIKKFQDLQNDQQKQLANVT